MLKILSKMKISSVLLAISAIVPALYSAPAAAESGSRVCGFMDVGANYFVLTKVNKGDTSTCNQAISALSRYGSHTTNRVQVYMQTCEYPSSRLGGGNIDRICGGKYRWTRDRLNGNPYFTFGNQQVTIFNYSGAVTNQYVQLVGETKTYPEMPNFPVRKCFKGEGGYGGVVPC